MKILLNGEERDVTPPLTIAGLADVLSLDPRKVAVEQNRAIVPRSAYEATPVADGDQIEIVCFVGGG